MSHRFPHCHFFLATLALLLMPRSSADFFEYPLTTSCRINETNSSQVFGCNLVLTGQIGVDTAVDFVVDIGFNHMVVNTNPENGGVKCYFTISESFRSIYSDLSCVVFSDTSEKLTYGKNHTLNVEEGLFEQFDMQASLLPFSIRGLSTTEEVAYDFNNSIGIGINSSFVSQIPSSRNLSSLFVNPVSVPTDFTGSTFSIGGWNRDHLRNSSTELALFKLNLTKKNTPQPGISISKVFIGDFLFYYSRPGDLLRFSTMDDGIFIPSYSFDYFMEFWQHQRCGNLPGNSTNCTFQAGYAPEISFELKDIDGQHHKYTFNYQQYVNQKEYKPMLRNSNESFWGNQDEFVIGLGPLSKLLLVIDNENHIMGIAESTGADFDYPGRGENLVFWFFGVFLGLPLVIWGLLGIYLYILSKFFKKENKRFKAVFSSVVHGGSKKKNKNERYASVLKSFDNEDFKNFPSGSSKKSEIPDSLVD